MSALSHFPNLRSLSLPSNTASASDYSLVRSPLTTRSQTTLAPIPPSKSLISARYSALERCDAVEFSVISELLKQDKPLQKLAFVRQIQAEDRMEYSVLYSRNHEKKERGDTVVTVMSADGEEVVLPVCEDDDAETCMEECEDEPVSLWDPLRPVGWMFESPCSSPSSMSSSSTLVEFC